MIPTNYHFCVPSSLCNKSSLSNWNAYLCRQDKFDFFIGCIIKKEICLSSSSPLVDEITTKHKIPDLSLTVKISNKHKGHKQRSN
mmetsp:Transcript_33540/g.51421  ORF Transcript_33540/g.51421 Transcript_33540/m.51421 type:complete len:85 (-) Transcript_33540:1438-1692(-)